MSDPPPQPHLPSRRVGTGVVPALAAALLIAAAWILLLIAILIEETVVDLFTVADDEAATLINISALVGVIGMVAVHWVNRHVTMRKGTSMRADGFAAVGLIFGYGWVAFMIYLLVSGDGIPLPM